MIRWKTVQPQHGVAYEAAYFGQIRVARLRPSVVPGDHTVGISIMLPVPYNSLERFATAAEAIQLVELKLTEFLFKSGLTFNKGAA